MDARELTKKATDQEHRIIILEKQVDYLTQELQKQRMIMDDIKVDVQMMQKRRQ